MEIGPRRELANRDSWGVQLPARTRNTWDGGLDGNDFEKTSIVISMH